MDRRACLLLVVVIALGAAWGYARGGRQAAAEVPAAATAAATAPPAAEVSATPEPPTGTPRQVFAHACGMCHALADAGSAGVTGPDLDELRPTAAQVRRKVRVGSLDGVMQPNLLRGAQAQAVARYVARAARR